MSERLQRTAASTGKQMLRRYGDEIHHKHDKHRNPFRQHCRTHPVTPRSIVALDSEENSDTSTGHIRAFKRRKCCKRLANERIH